MFFRRMLQLTSVNLLSQLLTIASIPYLTRVYVPIDFGKLALFNSTLIILYVIGCMRFDQLMYAAKNKQAVNNFLSIGMKMAFGVFAIIFSISFGVIKYLNESYIFLLVPVVMLMYSFVQLLTSNLSIDGMYKPVSIAVMLKTIVMLLVQCTMHRYLNGDALILGVVLGVIIQFCTLACYSRKALKVIFLKTDLTFATIKKSMLSTTQSIFGAVSGQLPIMAIPSIYGMEVNGLYSMATKLTQLPLILITNAIRPLILGDFNRKASCNIETKKTLFFGTFILSIIAVIAIIAINILAEPFFAWFSGEKWRLSGEIAGLLSFWLMTTFANLFALSYQTVIGNFKLLLCHELLLLFFRCCVVAYAMFESLEFMSFVFVYSVIGMAFNVILIIISMFTVINKPVKSQCFNSI